jgi:hypothetical protein
MNDASYGIRSDIYVDDHLASAGKIEDAIRKVTEVKKVLADGDFYLGYWVSNSKELLAAVQPVA